MQETLKKANEVTQNVREAATAFLALFGIIAALIVGQGYLYLKGWREQAEKSLSEIDEVRPDIDSIKEVRQTLETQLPTFLSKTREILDIEDPTNAIRQEDVALIDEIDHFTFLSTQQRFRDFHDQKSAAEYLESLRMSARGHLARRANWEAISRLNEYLRIVETVDARFRRVASKKNQALAYSYRAAAAYQLTKVLSTDPTWIKEFNAQRITKLRERALNDLRKAREIYSKRDYGDFVEALLDSSYFLPSTIMPTTMMLQGHEKAAESYKALLTPDTPSRKRRASYHNLACCLKRIASTTGESKAQSALQTELTAIPSDQELWEQASKRGEINSELHFLWQAMLGDEELFADLGKIHSNNYAEFWEGLLNSKISRRNWKDDLAELRKNNPKMNHWKAML